VLTKCLKDDLFSCSVGHKTLTQSFESIILFSYICCFIQWDLGHHSHPIFKDYFPCKLGLANPSILLSSLLPQKAFQGKWHKCLFLWTRCHPTNASQIAPLLNISEHYKKYHTTTAPNLNATSAMIHTTRGILWPYRIWLVIHFLWDKTWQVCDHFVIVWFVRNAALNDCIIAYQTVWFYKIKFQSVT